MWDSICFCLVFLRFAVFAIAIRFFQLFCPICDIFLHVSSRTTSEYRKNNNSIRCLLIQTPYTWWFYPKIFTYTHFVWISSLLLQFSIETDHSHDPLVVWRWCFRLRCLNVTCIFHFALWCHHHINNTFLRVSRTLLGVVVVAAVVARIYWTDDRCHCRLFRAYGLRLVWGIVCTRKIWIDRCAFMRMSGWMHEWVAYKRVPFAHNHCSHWIPINKSHSTEWAKISAHKFWLDVSKFLK